LTLQFFASFQLPVASYRPLLFVVFVVRAGTEAVRLVVAGVVLRVVAVAVGWLDDDWFMAFIGFICRGWWYIGYARGSKGLLLVDELTEDEEPSDYCGTEEGYEGASTGVGQRARLIGGWNGCIGRTEHFGTQGAALGHARLTFWGRWLRRRNSCRTLKVLDGIAFN